MSDVKVQVINPNSYRLHIGSPEGTRWLGLNTTVQEWNGGLYFDVDRTVELLTDMQLDGLTVETAGGAL
jgi:hypothetical protein